MEVRTKRYTYQTTVRWTGQKIGTITSQGKPIIEVATPPEFKGHPGIWSPEDLFVASANICLMTTFLSFAERNGLQFSGYESEAEGSLDMVDGKFMFTSITLRPKITLKSQEDIDKAKELLTKAEAHCLISNSMKCRVIIEPSVA